MTEPAFFETIYAQRAIRRFKPDPVPRNLIEQVIEAATRAPSGGNRQPWAFVVVQERGKKERIAEWYYEGWVAMYASDPSRPRQRGIPLSGVPRESSRRCACPDLPVHRYGRWTRAVVFHRFIHLSCCAEPDACRSRARPRHGHHHVPHAA